MPSPASARPLAAAFALILSVAAPAGPAAAGNDGGNGGGGGAGGAVCPDRAVAALPARPRRAPEGEELMRRLMPVAGARRDAALVRQILAGNVPSYLRRLVPVTLRGRTGDGRAVRVTVCVTPDYLAVGSDRDFVRVPLGLAAAAEVADRLGFVLPTPGMVDAIYRQAEIRLAPRPMKPGAAMGSTRYLLEHSRAVDRQRRRFRAGPAALTAGSKKDIVLSARLLSRPGRVAIYGWHRADGTPIQPLSTVHGAGYADYSHGIRLVGRTAFVNGRPVPVDRIMRDSRLARIAGADAPIPSASRLLATLY